MKNAEKLSFDLGYVDSEALRTWLVRWLPILSFEARRFDGREHSVVIASLLTAGAMAAGLLLLAEFSFYSVVGTTIVGVTGVLLVRSLLRWRFVKPLNEARDQYIGEMQAAIKEHDFPTDQIVWAIAAELFPCEYRDTIMTAIDPVEATLLTSHDQVLTLIEELMDVPGDQSQVFPKIDRVSDLQSYAYTYARAGFYGEAIAMLTLAELAYKAISAVAPEVSWQSGNWRYTVQAPWGTYSFREEVWIMSYVVSYRKSLPQSMEMPNTKGGPIEMADLLKVEQAASIEIQDQALIERCKTAASILIRSINFDYLETLLATSYIPGRPALFDRGARMLFKAYLFVPPIIEACVRRGAELESTLLKMLGGETDNERFNAAMALGKMRSEEAAKIATEILANETETIARIGALFILGYSGESGCQQELLTHLDADDQGMSIAAAIALEHLPMPVPDSILEKHLRHGPPMVQLRLTRHVKRYPEVSTGVRQAIASLVTEEDDNVGITAADTLSVLYSGDELFNLARDKLEEYGQNETIEKRLLFMVGRARTEAAVDLLLEAWRSVEAGQTDPERADHILGCLGETGSMHVVPELIAALEKNEFKAAALNTLITVSAQNREGVHDAAVEIKDDIIRLFFRAHLAGDQDEIDAFRVAMTSSAGDQRSLALQLAAILAHPSLKDTLNEMRKSILGNEIERPTWRFLATKASFAVMVRRFRPDLA